MSCSGWEKVKLDELVESISVKHKFDKEEIVFLNTSDVYDGKVLTSMYSEVDKLPGQAKKSIMKNDILFSEIRPKNRRFAYIDFDADDYVVSTKLMVLRRKSNRIDNRFLYQFLTCERTLDYLQMIAESRSGTFPQITFNELKKVEINLPTLEEQRAIATFLSSLDTKINLNNEMNKTLEEMAQTLFKRWFIDFEFPDKEGKPYKNSGGKMVDSEVGMIPNGWKVGVLADLVNIKYGKDHKKLEDGSIPVFGSGGIMRYVNKSLYEKESVLIPRKGTLNNVIYVNQPFWSVDTMFFTEMKLPNIAKFVYQFVKSKDLAMMNIGSAVPSMTTSILNSMEIVIPDEDSLEKYDEIVTSFYTKLDLNKSNSNNLITLRDLLLPKLMSGEIKVKDKEANL